MFDSFQRGDVLYLVQGTFERRWILYMTKATIREAMPLKDQLPKCVFNPRDDL